MQKSSYEAACDDCAKEDESGTEEEVDQLDCTAEGPDQAWGLRILTGHVPMSSPWPNLNIHDKDAEAFQNWCLVVEKVLSEAFEDAKCPYQLLNQKTLDEAEDWLGMPWGFQEFTKNCNFPNDENFEAWCAEMQARRAKASHADVAMP